MSMILDKPLIVMFESGDDLITHLWPRDIDTYQTYGLMICDLARHTAAHFNVPEDAVWDWVECERHHPTTTIKRAS